MARDVVMHLSLDEVVVRSGRRPISADAVRSLAASIQMIGLQTPITCRAIGAGLFELITGNHRLEAVRLLGAEAVPAVIVKWDDKTARKWEIAENLHRADLTELQRKEEIAEWIAITEAEQNEGVLSQIEPKPRGGRPESGVRAAARELGVERNEAQRAVKVASISERAKQAAVDAKLDNNQAALLKIASAPVERQVSVVSEIAQAKALKVQQDVQNRAATVIAEMVVGQFDADGIETFRVNLNVTTIKAISAAIANLAGEAIMDRRHG
jgi:ParB family transcriptional regulator, chromosome partitioning protein